MDIKKIISDIVAKITGKSDLIAKFTSDPAAIIKDLTGFEANAAQIKEIVSGVTSQIGQGAGDAVKGGKSILAKIKALFGKKG